MAQPIMNINEKLVHDFVNQNRPAKEIRDQLDLGYRFENNVIELFDIRPIWSRPSESAEFAFAKIKYIKTQKLWKLYWMRASGKWQSYEPCPESSHLEKLLAIIQEDEHGCFRG